MESFNHKLSLERDRLSSTENDASIEEHGGTLLPIEILRREHSILSQENRELRDQIEELLSERDDLMALADAEIVNRNVFLEEQIIELSHTNNDIVEDLRIRNAELQKQIEMVANERDEIQSVSASTHTWDSTDGTQRGKTKNKDQTKSRGWSFLSSQQPSSESIHRGAEIESLKTELEVHREENRRLKIDSVKLNNTMKNEIDLNRKRVETLESENSAYMLKIEMLEIELESISTKLADIEASSANKINKMYFGTGKKTIKELEEAMLILDQKKRFAETELDNLQKDFDYMAAASNLANERFVKEIDHMKKIQEDYVDQINALENVLLAINQENSALREMAQKSDCGGSVSVHSHAQFVQDEKDVKIAQLHYELVTLRMRLDTIRHEDLKQEIIMLEKEKLQLTGIWEAKIARLTEDNDEIIQSLQFRLRTREETIEMLEESLDLQLQKTAMAS